MTGQKSRIGLGIARLARFEVLSILPTCAEGGVGRGDAYNGYGGPGQMAAITECIRYVSP